MSISGQQLHVPVLPLHVPDGLRWGLRRGRLGRWTCSLWRLRGLGSRCCSSAGTVFGGFGSFLLPGGRPLRFGAGAGSAGVGGSATGAGTVAQALAQQACQALKPRGGPHSQPFPLVIILLVIVQENCK